MASSVLDVVRFVKVPLHVKAIRLVDRLSMARATGDWSGPGGPVGQPNPARGILGQVRGSAVRTSVNDLNSQDWLDPDVLPQINRVSNWLISLVRHED